MQGFRLEGLELQGAQVHRNLAPATLYEAALHLEPGTAIASTGALAAFSGAKTGRSPADKRIVRHEASEKDIWWGEGSPNVPLTPAAFAANKSRAAAFFSRQEHIFVQDGFVNWGPEVRPVTAELPRMYWCPPPHFPAGHRPELPVPCRHRPRSASSARVPTTRSSCAT